jgi:hypothetical protein
VTAGGGDDGGGDSDGNGDSDGDGDNDNNSPPPPPPSSSSPPSSLPSSPPPVAWRRLLQLGACGAAVAAFPRQQCDRARGVVAAAAAWLRGRRR